MFSYLIPNTLIDVNSFCAVEKPLETKFAIIFLPPLIKITAILISFWVKNSFFVLPEKGFQA